jgi:hypothetical protein
MSEIIAVALTSILFIFVIRDKRFIEVNAQWNLFILLSIFNLTLFSVCFYDIKKFLRWAYGVFNTLAIVFGAIFLFGAQQILFLILTGMCISLKSAVVFFVRINQLVPKSRIIIGKRELAERSMKDLKEYSINSYMNGLYLCAVLPILALCIVLASKLADSITIGIGFIVITALNYRKFLMNKKLYDMPITEYWIESIMLFVGFVVYLLQNLFISPNDYGFGMSVLLFVWVLVICTNTVERYRKNAIAQKCTDILN